MLSPELIGPVATSPAPTLLSRREREIFELLSRGLTGEGIAQVLMLSSETVKTHIRNAMVKLEASTRVHAIAIALRRGYISGLGPASSVAGMPSAAGGASERRPVAA